MDKEPASELSRAVTADDVATAAGVSRWTVNRAYRRDASISDKSREKVLAAAKDLGYVPDLHASSMRSEKTNLVALLVDDFGNPYKLVMMEAITSVLRRHGWDTLFVNLLETELATSALLGASQRRVDAAILIGVHIDEVELANELGARRVKHLVTFGRASNAPRTISVSVDDRVAMAEIADYVSSQGYRKPVFVAGPQTGSSHLMRKESFVDYWRANRGADPEILDVGSYDPAMTFKFVRDRYKGATELPDVMVCENDAIAIGAIDAIRHELGKRVRDDIAVTGFDDVPLAGGPNYRLTTYRQPLTVMAEAVVSILKGEEPAVNLTSFDGKLVLRESA